MFLINLIELDHKYISNDDRDIFELEKEIQNYDAEFSTLSTYPQPYQPAFQMPLQSQTNSLPGKVVDDFNNIGVNEEPMMMNQNTSQYDRARRGYEEHKDMSSLNRIFDIIEADMKELKPTMTAQDKQTAHQRLTTLSNMMNV